MGNRRPLAGRTLPKQVCRQDLPSKGRRCLSVSAAASAETVTTGTGLEMTEEQLPKSRVRLTVTVPPRIVKSSYAQAVKEGGELAIPGFRKGSAVPRDMLIRHMGGLDVFKEYVLEKILNETLPAVMGKYKAEALEGSENIGSTREELLEGLDEGKPFTYRVEFDVMPAIQWKGPYTDNKIEIEAPTGWEDEAGAVEAQVLSLRKNAGKLRIVVGRQLQASDVAIIKFELYRTDRQEQIPGASQDGMQLDMTLSETTFVPGVAAQMVGMNVGDKRILPVTLPDTWEPPALRGVECKCHVEVQELFEWDLPEETDEWANSLNPGVGIGGLAGLRSVIAGQRRQALAQDMSERIASAVRTFVGNLAIIDVPQAMVNQMGEVEYQTRLLRMQSQGQMGYEMMEKLATQELLEQFIETRLEELEALQKETLAIDEIARLEKLSVSEEELAEEVSATEAEFKERGEEFDHDRLVEQAREVLKAQKVLTWLDEKNDLQVLVPK